jgi:hypothetical protein
MKSSIIFSIALFATSILAAPHESMFAKHVQPRATRTRRDGPLPAHFTDSEEPEEPGNFFAVSYNSAWAGAILIAPPTGQIFNAVSGTFTVPTPSYPSGVTSGEYPAAIWVGIDGNTDGIILQSGIEIWITGAGDYSYTAWYEWYPDASINFSASQLSLTAGDVISISIKATNSSEGVVIMENVTTGQSVTQIVTSPGSASDLQGQSVEWIIEAYNPSSGGGPYLADFGSVLFTNAVAGTSGGEKLGPTGAQLADIESEISQIWNDCTTNNANTQIVCTEEELGYSLLTNVTLPSVSEVHIIYSAVQTTVSTWASTTTLLI